MHPNEAFAQRNKKFIEQAGTDAELALLTRNWFARANAFEYSYHFAWMSRPIIQYPQDVLALQELIWSIRPDLIIETGIAHGGSLIFSASMLALLDYCDAVRDGHPLNPAEGGRKVLGVDIEIRPHNRSAIESHPMSHKIEMIEGSSVAPDIVERVWSTARQYERVLVCLDSNHTHDHVLGELKTYAPLTSVGSYCVVFDTVIEDLPEDSFPDRPWGRGNNPKTAVKEFLRLLDKEALPGADGHPLRFKIDTQIDAKLQISVAPNGFLQRIP